MADNCFTILCLFLPYNNMNQPYVYTRSLSLEPPSNPYPSHPSRLSEHWGELPVSHCNFPLASYLTHGNVCLSATVSMRPTLSFPDCVHKSAVYVCISASALQIGSSVPFLWITYICIIIGYVLFHSV